MSYKDDLGVIEVREGKEYGFYFVATFLSAQEAKAVHEKIPKSYKVDLTLNYSTAPAWENAPLISTISASISFITNKTTGLVNESGRIRAEKIRQKLKEILPHYKVRTTVFVPVVGVYHTFKPLDPVKGWIQ